MNAGQQKPYAPDDPTEIVAVRLPIGPDEAALTEMVRAIAEEYALLGWSEARIVRLFANPRFAGPHTAYRALGAARIGELVAGVAPRRVDARG